MPSENFHEQEIEADGKFVRIRRRSDEFGSGIDASFGVTEAGAPVLKAIFFDKEKFTPAEAKEWLKEHDHPTSGFTEATGEEMSFHREKDRKKKMSELAGHSKAVEILRPGVFDSMKGVVRVTAQDIKDIVKNFAEFPDVPQILGHDEDSKTLQENLQIKTDTPAAGWTKRFFIKAGILFADIEAIPETVARWINAKVYKKVSLGFDKVEGKGAVARHIGLLGAMPPAVKGLADYPEVTFASGGFPAGEIIILAQGGVTMPQHITREEAITILKDAGMPSSVYAESVSDEEVIAAADAVVKMRDSDRELQGDEDESTAAKVGADIAQKVAEDIPEEVAEKVTPEVIEKAAEVVVAEITKEVKEPVEEETTEMSEAKSQLAAAKKEVQDAVTALRSEKRERQLSQLDSVVERLTEDGRLAPAETENFIALATGLLDVEKSPEIMLAAQDGGKEKLSAFDAHIRLAENRPRNILMGHVAAEGEAKVEEGKRGEDTAKIEADWSASEMLQGTYPDKTRYVENQLLVKGYKVELDKKE